MGKITKARPRLSAIISKHQAIFAEPLERRIFLSVSLLNDINPGSGAAIPQTVGVFKNRLYFFADDGVHGSELWSTDGTAGGAALLKDINPGSGSGAPFVFGSQATSQYLFFNTHVGDNGAQVWRTDGTPEGTLKLTKGGLGTSAVLNDKLYFLPQNSTAPGLWTSDGTPQGTVPVPSGAAITEISAVMDGVLYCVGSDTAHGSEVWRSDGTANGTYRLTDVKAGSLSSFPTRITAIGHTLLFFANDLTNTSNLYKYTIDAGVELLKDIKPGASDFGGGSVTVANGRLYFSSYGTTVGGELWASDGTADGTSMVTKIVPETGSGVIGKIFNFNGIVLFTVGSKLYRSDGTADGTYLLSTIFPADGPTPGFPTFVTLGNYAYFPAALSSPGVIGGVESIWRTDGISGITMAVDMPTNISTPFLMRSQMVAFNGDLYFSSDDKIKGNEFWTYSPDDPPLTAPIGTFTPTTGVTLQFDRPIADDIVRTSMVVVRITTSTQVITGNAAVTKDPAAGIVRVTFPGFPNAILANANYAILFLAGYIHDQSENPLSADFRFEFFALAGDANQDRKVDFADLVTVAQNYATPTGATYADGDFNGDGAVNFADLVTIAQNYGKSLAPPPSASLPVTAPQALAPAKSDPKSKTPTLFNIKAPIQPVKQTKPKPLPSRR